MKIAIVHLVKSEIREVTIMDHVLEAIYESGVFKPLETIHLSEHQRVLLTIHSLLADSPHTKLEAWQQVYAGLSDQDITEIEAIALDRSRFLAQDD